MDKRRRQVHVRRAGDGVSGNAAQPPESSGHADAKPRRRAQGLLPIIDRALA
jgi:hypothetical protein